MVAESTPVSVLIPTIRGWPAAREALERVVAQTVGLGGEVLVLDGSDRPAPSDDELLQLGGPVRWIKRPGDSVFQLRLAGYRAASGEVVAITEDHVFVPPDWAKAHLDVHARHPEAGVVGGAVVNGTDARLIDRAAFFLTQAPFMPPLENGVTERVAVPANVSYKRRVLDRLSKAGDELGVIDFIEMPAALEGETLVADDRIQVLHHQSPGFMRLSLAEFDNGRTIAGYRRRRMSRGDWLRILAAPALPLFRSVRALRIVAGKRAQRDVVVKAAPVHVWFQYCAMAGELVGYLSGPGRSPHRLY